MSTLRQNVEHPRSNAQISMWPAGEQLRREFWRHRREHPEVWNELLRLALELRREGREHYGIAALFEVVRYNQRHVDPDGKGFRMNNDLRAHYARALMQEQPELDGFFATRTLRSA